MYEETLSRYKFTNSISISRCCVLFEQRVNQVKAKLATIQSQFMFYDSYPLLWFWPTFDRETGIDTEM
jgi:hypothetical protein